MQRALEGFAAVWKHALLHESVDLGKRLLINRNGDLCAAHKYEVTFYLGNIHDGKDVTFTTYTG